MSFEQRAADTGEAFVAFDIDADYRRYVDGKPRYDGAAASLRRAGLALPGTPADGPGAHTVHALGNLKDQYFMQHLEQHGVESMKRSRLCAHCGRRTSRRRSCPPATTARRCSRPPG